MKHNLAMRILFECLSRAWFGNEANRIGLTKGQFLFSKSEYSTLWLKKWQANQIVRTLQALEREGMIQKMKNKTGNKNANIYQFVPNEFITPLWSLGNWLGRKDKIVGSSIGTKDIYNTKDVLKDREDALLLKEKVVAESKKQWVVFDVESNPSFLLELLSPRAESVVAPLKDKIEQDVSQVGLLLIVYRSLSKVKKDDFWNGKITNWKTFKNNLDKLVSFCLQNFIH